MRFSWLFTGALCCALSVLGGAFGAHVLAGRLDLHALQLWEVAARYLMYGGVGQVLSGLCQIATARSARAAGLCLLAGSLLFCGTVFALALGGPRWLGAATPMGGLLLIAGFVLLAVLGLRGSPRAGAPGG